MANHAVSLPTFIVLQSSIFRCTESPTVYSTLSVERVGPLPWFDTFPQSVAYATPPINGTNVTITMRDNAMAKSLSLILLFLTIFSPFLST